MTKFKIKHSSQLRIKTGLFILLKKQNSVMQVLILQPANGSQHDSLIMFSREPLRTEEYSPAAARPGPGVFPGQLGHRKVD